MDKINPLFTATATASGGRNGRTESDDGIVKADLSVPKAMGGPGKPGTATPEHLFAAGYAACFGGALDFVGKQQKKDASKAKVTCAVSIGPRDGGGFGLAVKMRVEDKIAAAGRARGARARGAREDLPVLARDARQRQRAVRGRRRFVPELGRPGRFQRACASRPWSCRNFDSRSATATLLRSANGMCVLPLSPASGSSSSSALPPCSLTSSTKRRDSSTVGR